jgi:hypothetical protein
LGRITYTVNLPTLFYVDAGFNPGFSVFGNSSAAVSSAFTMTGYTVNLNQ